MGEVEPAERGQFRRGVTEHAAEGSIDLQHARVGGGHAQAERRILESHPETRFVIAQRLLGCFGLGNVVNDGSRTGDLPSCVSNRTRRNPNLDPFAILPDRRTFKLGVYSAAEQTFADAEINWSGSQSCIISVPSHLIGKSVAGHDAPIWGYSRNRRHELRVTLSSC